MPILMIGRLVPDMFHQHLSVWTNRGPFHLQQPDLHLPSSLEPTGGSVRLQGPVTWDHEREWIAGQGISYRSCTTGNAEMPGNAPVGTHIPPGDCMFSEENMTLE